MSQSMNLDRCVALRTLLQTVFEDNVDAVSDAKRHDADSPRAVGLCVKVNPCSSLEFF